MAESSNFGRPRLNPLRIPCTNCGGKLVIRSDKYLGKILPCPRCQNLVTIPATLPEESQTAPPILTATAKLKRETPPVDSQAMTAMDLPAPKLAADLGDLPASSKPSVEYSQALTNSFDLEHLPELEHLSAGGNEASLARQQMFDAIDEFAESSEVAAHDIESVSQAAEALQPPSPAAAWDYSQSRRRQMKLLVGLAVVVSLFSVGLLTLFIRSVRVTQTPPTDTIENPKDSQSTKLDQPILDKTAIPPNDPKAVVQTDVALPEKQPIESNDTTAAASNDTGKAIESNQTEIAETKRAEPAVETEASTVTPSAKSNEVPSLEDPLMAFLRDTTPQLNLDGSNDGNKKFDAVPEEAISAMVPDALRKYAPLFDFGSQAMQSDAELMDPSKVDGGEVSAEPLEVSVYYHPEAAKIPNWEELSQSKIPRLKFVDQPLLEVLYTLESIHGVGFDWDIDTISHLDLDLAKKTSLDVKDSTLAVVMQQLLKPYHLKLQASAEQLPQIVLANDFNLPHLPEAIELQFWLDEKATAQSWLQFFQDLFPRVSAQFTLDGDRLILPQDLNQQEADVLYDLIAQLNSQVGRETSEIESKPKGELVTQLTNKVQPDSTSDPLGLMSSTIAALQDTGDTMAVERRPVGLVLHRAAAEVGLSILIDWDHVWRHGLTPQTTTVLLTKNRTLAQTTRFILDQYALEIVVDAKGRLILTTPETQRQSFRYLMLASPAEEPLLTLRKKLASLAPASENGRSALRVIELPKDFRDAKKEVMSVAKLCPPAIGQLTQTSLIDLLESSLQVKAD